MVQTRAELAIDFIPAVLEREGAAWVRAVSSSMAPLIQPGDEVRLVPPDAGRVQRGALVAFRRDGALVVHRVLSRTPDGLVTKGDALPDTDAPVEWRDLIGRVTAIRTPRGRLVDFGRWPWPLVEGVLGRLARPSPCNRLAWIARRAPFHLIARLSR